MHQNSLPRLPMAVDMSVISLAPLFNLVSTKVGIPGYE